VYALPYDGDVLELYYRKDFFENPQEKETFKQKYGRDLTPPAMRVRSPWRRIGVGRIRIG
jgi:hypothetical protein